MTPPSSDAADPAGPAASARPPAPPAGPAASAPLSTRPPALPARPPAVVHEIRVHGVNNSPPAEMLETTPDDIRVVTGTGAGVFWRRRTQATGADRVAVEAYSWGAQARTGAGALAVIGSALVHIGWFLLMPYALVNLAYWTREIPDQDSRRKAWVGGVGAGAVRLFGLVLTLIATAAFTTVAVDLIAVQCYRSVDGARRVCAALPGAFDVAAGWSEDVRTGVFGILPILVLVVLYAIVRRGRVGFEPALESFGRTLAGQDEPGRPLLSTPGFWTAARVRDTSEWLHLAAATFLVVFLLAFRSDPTDPWRVAFELGAGAGIAVCAVVLVLASSTPAREGADAASAGALRWIDRSMAAAPEQRTARKQSLAFWALVVAIALYAGWCATEALRRADAPGGAAYATVPTVLIAAALLLALWGLSWSRRSRARRWTSLCLLVGAGACWLATLVWPGGLGAGVLTSLGMVLVGLHVALCLWRPRPVAGAAAGAADPTLFQGWSGRGPAVGMLLALLVSISLSSLLVLGVSAFLSVVPSSPDRFQRVLDAPLTDTEWAVPDAYEKSAIVLTLVVVGLVVLLTLLAVTLLRARALGRLTLPALAWRDPSSVGAEREAIENAESGVAAPGPGYPEVFDLSDPPAEDELALHLHAEARARRRRLSHLVHRGEPLATWIAGLTAVGLVVLVSPGAVELIRLVLERVAPGSPTGIRIAAVSVLAVVAVGAAAKVVADAVSHRDRPLGTFWDVVGFLPRAGHPFAPPCFGERCIPELVERVRRLVRPEASAAAAAPGAPGSVLLSAHSMGSTISAATIFALRGEGDGRGGALTDHLALLSFGSQLRGFFSRFFPSVLGPAALGVPGLRGPSLWAVDPWRAQVAAEFAGDAGPAPAGRLTTLRGILTSPDASSPRWRNLWRRTDFLGFPVFGYPSAGNPVDRGATETPPGYLWTLATHSPYLGVEQFEIARGELVAALRTPPAPPPPPPPPPRP